MSDDKDEHCSPPAPSGVARIWCEDGHTKLTENNYQIHVINSDKAVGFYILLGSG